jgi:hypothetical protein
MRGKQIWQQLVIEEINGKLGLDEMVNLASLKPSLQSKMQNDGQDL